MHFQVIVHMSVAALSRAGMWQHLCGTVCPSGGLFPEPTVTVYSGYQFRAVLPVAGQDKVRSSSHAQEEVPYVPHV